MSASPFISEDSIWSNAAVTSRSPRPQSPQMPGSLSLGGVSVVRDTVKPSLQERNEQPRVGTHPLPTRPVQSQPLTQRTASALSARSNASEEQSRSYDSQLHSKPGPGAIGGHRLPSRAAPLGTSDLNSHLGRSNSLAASVHSFRSANSASPSTADLNLPISAGRHLFQRQNSINGPVAGSPTLASSSSGNVNTMGGGTGSSPCFQGGGSPSPSPSGHLGCDNNPNGETELGTPRLFLDSQHVFGGGGRRGGADDGIASLDGSWSLSRSGSVNSNNGGVRGADKPRPRSWIQPQTTAPSLQHVGDRAFSGQSQRSLSGEAGGIRASSVGPPSPKMTSGSSDLFAMDLRSMDSSQGYPFPSALSTVSRRSGGQSGRPGSRSSHGDAGAGIGGEGGSGAGPGGGTNLTSSPIEASDLLNASNLTTHVQHQVRASVPRTGSSPGPASLATFAGSQSTSGGRGTPTLHLPRNLNLLGGLLSPAAATIGSTVATPGLSPLASPHATHGQPASTVSHVEETGLGASAGFFDEQLRASPFLNDLLDRLNRVELGMKDFSRQVSGISRNVSLLLERTKGLPPASLAGGSNANGGAMGGNSAAAAHSASQDEIRALNSQVTALASSVSHLLTLQGNGASGASGSTIPLAGLGFGSTTFLGTPQLGGPAGGPERSASPRVGMGPLHAFGPTDNVRGLSPRPGAGGRGWSAGAAHTAGGANPRRDSVPVLNAGLGLAPSTPTIEEGTRDATGNFLPGSGSTHPNAIVSKWEHLNLHPDLLRSILKYGLGPPNKIQQRALPFLLRGSDIIAQAPPTQERIASYVIPALQLVLNAGRENALSGPANSGFPGLNGRLNPTSHSAAFPPPTQGPVALIVSTTVDQATQAQRMALGLGSSLGIRVHIAAAGGIDVHQEAQAVAQSWPHIVVGTPQKMSELFTYLTNNAPSLASLHGGAAPISTAEVRLVVLDEVDQLIARNLADHVSSLLRVLPQPSAPHKADSGGGASSPGLPPTLTGVLNIADASKDGASKAVASLDRQVALFSNTVPQDVLNFAQSIHLRESVRVLVRRDGGAALPGGHPSTTIPSSALGGPQQGGSAGSFGPAHSSGFLPPKPGIGREGVAQPSNALGAHPANSSINALNDPIIAAVKGLRQYYLYVAVASSGGGGGLPSPNPGMGPHAANEMKLDLITDLMEDIEFGQAVVYCSNSLTLEAIIYKLASKGVEAMGLSRELNSHTRQQTLARFRSPTSQFGTGTMAGTPTFSQPAGFVGVAPGTRTRKVLVVCDMAVNPKDVHQIPLVVFYDMPRSVDDYKEKIACAAAGAMARPSVCINVVTASGGPRGDVEMLRTLECHLGCKMAELPVDAKQILNY